MKKKLLSFILAICLIMPCALVLTACGGKDPDHTHSWSSTYSHNSTQHWKTCSGCDDLGEKNDHTYNVDTCSVCGYVNSNLTPATLQSMDTYFSGVKAEYLKDSFVGADNQTVTFEELLDTQIEVLVQDILYRITAVYGANENQKIVSPENLVLNKTIESNNQYCFGNSSAKIKLSNLLSKTATHDSTHVLDYDNEKLAVNCIDCYQVAATAETVNNSSDNLFYHINFINFAGAIEGNYTELSGFKLKNPAIIGKNAWVGWDSNLDSTYENVLSTYTKSLKMGIASILANKTPTAAYYEAEYNNLLSSISSLGYFEGHKNLIANFIKNKIIGSDLVTKDDAIYNCDYFVENNYVVNLDFSMNAPYNNGTFTAEEIKNSPRLYKGYSVVVPAIVEQALENTFEDTNVSLYPKMSRTAYESTTTTTGFVTEKEYQTITLMPKADAVTTKLVVKFTGVGSSIGQTIALDYDVVINGTTYSGTKNITLTSTEQEVEIDLNAITNGSTLGAYNGTTTSHTSGNAFSNNDFDAQGNLANSDGNNYIKLDFNNTNNYSFIVTFGGMYNK